MSQLRVYETSRPAATPPPPPFSPITQTHLFLSLSLSASFSSLSSSARPFCSPPLLPPNQSVYTFLSSLTHIRFTVYRHNHRACKQSATLYWSVRVCIYSFNYLNIHTHTHTRTHTHTHTRRVVYQSNLISVFKCVTSNPPPHRHYPPVRPLHRRVWWASMASG